MNTRQLSWLELLEPIKPKFTRLTAIGVNKWVKAHGILNVMEYADKWTRWHIFKHYNKHNALHYFNYEIVLKMSLPGQLTEKQMFQRHKHQRKLARPAMRPK